MSQVEFEVLTDSRHQAEILSMMQALYIEDHAASPVSQSHFSATVEFLVSHPAQGRIVVFTERGSLRGYAVIIPYWSNEFGGVLLFIDEIFVLPDWRNNGIARTFFAYLAEQRPFEAVALALEVSPLNVRAHRLYESLGFRVRRNSSLTLRLEVHAASDTDGRR